MTKVVSPCEKFSVYSYDPILREPLKNIKTP